MAATEQPHHANTATAAATTQITTVDRGLSYTRRM